MWYLPWSTSSRCGASRSSSAATTGRSSSPRRSGAGWPGRGSKTLYIEPGSPWENAYSETFNSRLRDELLDREVFETLKEAKVILEDHRLDYNHRRPHSSLGYRTPAEFAAAQIKPGVASLPPADAVPIPDPALS